MRCFKTNSFDITKNDGDKDKSKYNLLICFCIDDDKLLEKYKTIWTKT